MPKPKTSHPIPLIEPDDAEYAKQKLQDYYAKDFIPPDKKTYLTDLRKGQGPYLGVETAGKEAHYIMDAASQIASLGLGFNASVFMGTAHFQEAWTNDTQGEHFRGLWRGFKSFLKRQTHFPQLTTLLCNSGSEANEVALGLCAQRRPHQEARKVLAFEGSFYGRTLFSLFSTWSPGKREPFQIPGLETVFCPYPELEGSEIEYPFPQEWRTFWENAPDTGLNVPAEWPSEATLKREIDSLMSVRRELLSGQIFAIIIEPMQCEGGDRYSSGRFHTALLSMAKSFQVPLIYDEIQTGFHLGQTFFWHRQFHLKSSSGEALYPDYVTCAKKAQSGLVLCSQHLQLAEWERNGHIHVASVIRGYQHALALEQSRDRIHQLEKKVWKRLNDFIEAHQTFVERPRAQGLAFAFDLKDASQIQLFVGQRFAHGLLYYPAGEKTLRFRLNTAFSDADLDFLFERLETLAQKIFLKRDLPPSAAHPTSSRPMGQQTDELYQWHELLLRTRWNVLHGKRLSEASLLAGINQIMHSQGKLCPGEEIILVDDKNYPQYNGPIQELQRLSYEPARQTREEIFKAAASSALNLCLVLESREAPDGQSRELKAISFSSLPKDHSATSGVRQDPHFLDLNGLYAMDTTVHPQHRHLGLGRPMKYALAALAMNRGIERIQGRTRDKVAASMLSINLSLGAYEQSYLREDYRDSGPYRDVFYYTSPLQWKKTPPRLSDRINAPLGLSHLDFDHVMEQLPSLNNKICLSNFVGRRFLDLLKSIAEQVRPELRHLYSASGQAECTDKIFKSLWHYGRRQKRTLTFEGHCFGHGTFLARALSGTPSPHFAVDILPQEDLACVREAIEQNDIMAVWIEPLRQQDLRPVPLDFLKGLKALLAERGIPLVYNETAAQSFSYSQEHYFASGNPDIAPNASFAFLGGQSAMAMLERQFFVEKPLMMISTWDGDELSLGQYHWAMQYILSDPQRFFEMREKFHQALTRKLSSYPVELKIKDGRGTFCGPVPVSLQRLFRRQCGQGQVFVVDPSYAEMENFLTQDI